METPFTPPPSPPPPDQTLTMVKPLKPLVYNFFISDRPEQQQLTLDDLSQSNYKSFHSHKLEVKNGHVFKPTIQFKKLVDEPKFFLSVQRKKIKIMKGINQKASSQKPSRNSYRGRKLKTVNKTLANQEDIDQPEVEPKDKRIESQQPTKKVDIPKTKQPNLHFNLRFVLQSRRNFTGQFSREQNITGTNYPYFNYFSSIKSSVPQSERSSRYKSSRKSSIQNSPRQSQSKRFMSTTMGMRTKPFYQNL